MTSTDVTGAGDDAPSPDGQSMIGVHERGSEVVVPPIGLTEAEAQARRAAGQSNGMPLKTSRSYGRIVRENVFNFINNVLFTLGALLIGFGRYLDALICVGVVALNSLVSLVQEIRAKILLDRIAILTRPKATVVRDDVQREVDPGEIVLGDLLVLHAGDQVVVDGHTVGEGRMEMDESLLTGESDLVPKRPGDELLSGSFCAAGGGMYVAERVGTDCYVNRLTSGAQAFRRVLTPLQHKVNLIIRSLLLMAVGFVILVLLRKYIDNFAWEEAVRMSTVIVALIPNGLILSMALAYALGAVRMAGKGALVQQGNAIESMSNVDVLCTDKTGTLTTNTIKLHDVLAYSVDRLELERLLGDFAASTSEGNRTSEALLGAYHGKQRAVIDEAVFSSDRKWSGLVVDEGGMRGAYVLGAPEVLLDDLRPGSELGPQLDEWTSSGLRVLLFAVAPDARALTERDEDGAPVGEPQLPADLVPLGLVALSDELRPKVRDTLRQLEEACVDLKIISGDNAQTVAALARQAGLSGDLSLLSGAEIDRLDDVELQLAVEETAIFGRVTPHQKERLVGALRENGHYVAMIGDGVNDVISLKRANVSIAMQGGSQAARAVSDIILLKDSFGALPWAFREGQRIFNGMGDILRIFMVRILSKALLIAAIGFLGGFPFQPRQAALLSFFAAGIPAIALAAFARPGHSDREHVLYDLMRFVMPAALIMSLLAVAMFSGYIFFPDVPVQEFRPGAVAAEAGITLYRAQTVITTFAVFCSLLLLPMTVPPTKFWTGGAPLRKDWKMTILALLLLAGYIAVALSELGRLSFDLAVLSAWDFLITAAFAVVWMFATRFVWRHRILERFLGLIGPDGAQSTATDAQQAAHAGRYAERAPAERSAVAHATADDTLAGQSTGQATQRAGQATQSAGQATQSVKPAAQADEEAGPSGEPTTAPEAQTGLAQEQTGPPEERGASNDAVTPDADGQAPPKEEGAPGTDAQATPADAGTPSSQRSSEAPHSGTSGSYVPGRTLFEKPPAWTDPPD